MSDLGEKQLKSTFCVCVFCAVFPLFEGRISGQGVGISRVGGKKKATASRCIFSVGNQYADIFCESAHGKVVALLLIRYMGGCSVCVSVTARCNC